MKPATPILRNEHYLDVMTGGSASLPSPILREERYLAKLAGMEVNIPSPVTIKEKYYAKICGMDVDVPTYTRNMPRIYAYMAKAAGQTIEDLPTAVTREQRYWFDYVSDQPVGGYTIAAMQALTIAQLQTHTISELQGGI